MFTLEAVVFLATVVFTLTVLVLNVRFNTEDNLYIFTTGVAFFTMIGYVIILYLSAIANTETMKPYASIGALVIYNLLIMIQISVRLTSRRRESREIEKFISTVSKIGKVK